MVFCLLEVSRARAVMAFDPLGITAGPAPSLRRRPSIAAQRVRENLHAFVGIERADTAV